MPTFTEIVTLKTLLITGINSGIGLHISLYLSQKGYMVLGTVRRNSQVPDILLRNPNIQIFELCLDNDEQLERGFKHIRKMIPPDGLYAFINNAGMVVAGPATEISLPDYRYQFQINLFAGIHLIQLCLPYLIRYGAGARVIHISSVSGLFGSPFLGAYVASKYAGEGFFDSLRRELSLIGLRTVKIVAGSINTPIWEKQLGLLDKFETGNYWPYLQVANSSILKMKSESMPLETINKPILKALEHTCPRPSYLVYKKKWMFLLLTKILPVTFVDRMIRNRLKMKTPEIRT